jgi:hypothetical protein
VNVELLRDYFTIGINRAYRLLDPTILFWQDLSVWETDHQQILQLQALKVARESSDPRKICYNIHIKGGDFYFDPDKKTHLLYGSGTSAPLVAQLAYALGCSPIVIIGIDCRLSPSGQKEFYGDNPFWTPQTLNHCQRGLIAMKKLCPVPIRNCGTSPLWPTERLENILDDLGTDRRRSRDYFMQLLLRDQP